MQIYKIRPYQKYPKINRAVIALGSFDGVHRGHHKILQTGILMAHKLRAPFGIISFMPIPQRILFKEYHFILTTDKEKANIFRDLGIDFLGTIKFTNHLCNIEAKQFIFDYIIKTIKPSVILVGADYRFGKEHKGNVSLLKKLGVEYGFDVKVVLSLKFHNAVIKSTRIRELIILGNVRRAHELLTRPYSITGIIKKGKGLAKQLGFPTLNLHIPEKEKLVPADGVYHVRTIFSGGEYDGVMNIGFAPTISDKFRAYQMRSLEVHLFDFSGTEVTALGKQITVEFFERLRPEKKFDSLEELKNQIAEDVKKVKALIE